LENSQASASQRHCQWLHEGEETISRHFQFDLPHPHNHPNCMLIFKRASACT